MSSPKEARPEMASAQSRTPKRRNPYSRCVILDPASFVSSRRLIESLLMQWQRTDAMT